MKKQLTIFLFFAIFKFVAQTTDVRNQNKILTDNHYGPFHQTIRDTIKKTLSTFGHYISFAYGAANNFGEHGHDNELLSYSLAYKSHIVSITCGANQVYGDKYNDPGYGAHYFGLLIGESLRFKHLMLSLSTGAAYSNLVKINYAEYPTSTNNAITIIKHNDISVPIELKLFVLAKNNVGIGIHISENIEPSSRYSALYLGFSIVAGHWNSQKNKRKVSH